MSLSAGTRIGVYQIVSLLGAGGMGRYRAHDTMLRRDVALKLSLEIWPTNPNGAHV